MNITGHLNKFKRLVGVTIFTLMSAKANANTSEPKERVLALAPHIVEMLFEIGVGDKIVGTTEHSDYPSAALNIPRIGNYARLKIEDIVAIQPDLIIAWRTGNPSDDLARLEKLGFSIVYSDPKKLEDVAKELVYFGELTGAGDIAKNKAKKYLDGLQRIKQLYADKAPISVFYELWSRPLTTIAKNAWPQQAIALCSVSNPFYDSLTDYPQIGVEQVVMAKPQLIVQPMSKGEPNPDAINWQQWQEIPASKHKQLIQPNSDKLHRMTSRLLDEVDIMCKDIEHTRNYYSSQEK